MVNSAMQSSDRGGEILIVEDSPTQARQLQHILEEHGYRVTHASNGSVALEAAHQRKPDLIISDVVMPEMNGYELCRRVKADRDLSDVPVILVTTLSDPGDVIRGLECRADNFILKPYDKQYLVSRVQFVLMNRVMRQSEPGGIAVEIFFNGQRHVITADRLQILNLLLSTYDAAIQRNKELTRTKAELAERGTALLEQEHELRKARAFLEHLIAASPAVMIRLEPFDGDFRVTYVSPNIVRVLGYSVEEVVAAPRWWRDLIHPADSEVMLFAIESIFQGGASQQLEHELRCRAKDGEYRWMLATLRTELNEQKRPAAVLCHALDITDRKHAEEETRRAERFLDSIVENVPSAIFVKDARDLRLVRLNRASEDLFGDPRSEALGQTVYDLSPKEQADAFTAQDREALRQEVLIDIPEEVVQTRLRGVRTLHTRKLPIVGEDGVPQYLLGISEDITERKGIEQALAMAKREAERANRAKSDFLSRMSHDLRTPLNAILGFAQLLEMDALGAEQHESVRHIIKGGSHLLDLINEVLDLARIESGHLSLSPEPVHIAEVVQSVVDLIRPLAAARDIHFHTETIATSGARQVLADRQRFSQILLNLLSNAVKYNRDGGRVDVTCEVIRGGRVRIKVSDMGKGIPSQKLQQLFQPFERLGAEQSSIEGTGLGLMVSKGLAQAMGGMLGVESEVGRGSTFWLELPHSEGAAESGPPQGRAQANAAADSGVSGTVLYIEDNISNRRLMERLIARRPGVRLVAASNGREGLDLACAHQPNLVLLDLHLPDMTGEEVLRRLKEEPRTATIPVAVLSADAMPLHTRKVLASGAAAYLTKPLDIGGVLQFLDDTLGQRSG